jgi:hypothetical protein
MPYTAAQLTAYYTAINLGQAPDAATAASFSQTATNNAAGIVADQAALAAALRNLQVRATTDVAVAIYQYFNGSAPSAAGLNFLVNTPGTGLNTSYYNGATGTPAAPSAGGFNLENRYYNLAVSQAFQGPNATGFATTYGALTLQQTVATAYEQIVGAAVVGTPQANAAIAAIQGSIAFFQQVAAERATGFNQDLAAKAIIVGYILEESIKAGVGAYALAIDQHNAAIAAGNAVYNANILTTYAPGGPAYGTGVGGGVLPVTLAATSIAQQRLNLPAGIQVNITGTLSGGTILQLRDASGLADSISLIFSNGNVTGAPGVAGASLPQLSLGGTAVAGTVETLNIQSAGALTSGTFGSENGITFNAATAPNTVVIRGGQPFFLFTGPVTHSMLIDGTAATGSLTLRGDPATAAGVAINLNGGSADDTLEAGQSSTAVAQAIYGAGGGDLILLNGGTFDFNNDTVSGGAATHKAINTLVYKSVTDSLFDPANDSNSGSSRSANANTGKTDLVVGFITGQDKIDVKGLGMTQAQLTIADKGDIADLAAFNALVASGTFYVSGGATRGASIIHNGGDTYLFIDVNHNGVFDAAADLAIRLVGVATIVPADLVGN